MFPKLSGGLTEILLGGSYRGVSLGAAIFREPGQPLAARGRTTTEKRAIVAAERDKRFECTLRSLDRLIEWAKTERRSFLERILQLPPRRPAKVPIAQGEGLPDVADDFEYLESRPEAADEADEASDECDDAELDESMPIRSFAPKRMGESAFGDSKSRDKTFVDLFVEDFVADDQTVQNAAVDLAQACARMSDISTTPPILTIAEVQTLTGDGHEPLQHEIAHHEDSPSSSGEEDVVVGPGSSGASAGGVKLSISLWRVQNTRVAKNPIPIRTTSTESLGDLQARK